MKVKKSKLKFLVIFLIIFFVINGCKKVTLNKNTKMISFGKTTEETVAKFMRFIVNDQYDEAIQLWDLNYRLEPSAYVTEPPSEIIKISKLNLLKRLKQYNRQWKTNRPKPMISRIFTSSNFAEASIIWGTAKENFHPPIMLIVLIKKNGRWRIISEKFAVYKNDKWQLTAYGVN